MKIVTLICDNPDCRKSFDRPMREHTRSKKMGRPEYCCSSCSAVFRNRSPKRTREITNRNLIPGNHRDEFTPFRWYMGRVRSRRDKKGSTDLTVEYLKLLWDKQQGRCLLTGWEMVLPISTRGNWSEGCEMKRASLDRIDSSKGYVQGNVRFVSQMANYAKNKFTDDELIEFCRSVISKHGDKAK